MGTEIAAGYVELSEKGLSSVEGVIGRVAEKFKAMLSPMGLVSEGLAALGAGAGIGGMLSMAMGVSRVRTGFDQLTRSAGVTDELLGGLKKQFSGTSIPVESYRAAAGELLQLGVAAGDIPARLQKLGNIAAATGAPLDAMAGALRRMEITGKVTSRTIFMLGPSIQDALQKAYPALGENLAQAADEGRIGIKQIEAAIDSLGGAHGEFSGAMAAQQDDMLGHWERLKEGVGDALTRIGEWIYHAFDLGAVSDNLGAFADRFVNEWGGKIQGTLKAVKTKVQELWEFIAKHKEAEISIAAMTAGFVAVKEAIGEAVKVVKWLAAAHATVTTAMKTQTVWAAILAALSGQWQNLVAASLVAAALGAYELYSWLHKAADEKARLAQPLPSDMAETARRNEAVLSPAQAAANVEAAKASLKDAEEMKLAWEEAWRVRYRAAREAQPSARPEEDPRVQHVQAMSEAAANEVEAAKAKLKKAESQQHEAFKVPPPLSGPLGVQKPPHVPDAGASFVGLSQLAEKMQMEASRAAEQQEMFAQQQAQTGHLSTLAGAAAGEGLNVRIVNTDAMPKAGW